MGALSTVLIIIGILALLESLIVLLFPNWSIRIGRRWIKNKKNVKKAGLVELIVAIILILIGMNV